jgi:hypothetical protein
MKIKKSFKKSLLMDYQGKKLYDTGHGRDRI